MKRLPTDLEILDAIFDRYFDAYASLDHKNPGRMAKNYVPIDIPMIAMRLGTEDDIVFARLHYHLEHKYGYRGERGEKVYFFANSIENPMGREVHCVNFPYMSSVLAELRHEHKTARRNYIAAAVSAVGAILSVVCAAVAIILG